MSKIYTFCCLLSFSLNGNLAYCQLMSIDASPTGRKQIIDGFGSCLYEDKAEAPFFAPLYYDDASCSILRMDMVPLFKSPVSDFAYNSPWFHGNPSLPARRSAKWC